MCATKALGENFHSINLLGLSQSSYLRKEITVPEYLEFHVDKFTFKVATDRFYSREGLWAKEEGGLIRIGLSDFIQQRSGDVAFAEVKPVEAEIAFDEEVAVIETIKVDTSFGSPVGGTIVNVNPAMEDAPEVINEDPYHEGWLVEIDPAGWEADRARLLTPQAYFEQIKIEAEEEAKRL
jgi:glycine cleavage system H protein